MRLLILSAGLGTRLKPITNKVPKPALPILNIPMLFWNYFYFKNKPLQNKIVNTYHLADILRDKISEIEKGFIYSSDGKEVLGTGGGISNNRDLLQTSPDFWVINGDGFFLTESNFIQQTEDFHAKNKALATLVVCEHPDVGSKFGGIWVDSKDKILAIGKSRPYNAVKGYHFSGFRLLSNKIFDYLPSHGAHELFDTLNECLDKELIQFVKVEGSFFETGNKEDFLYTNKQTLSFLKKGPYQSLIKKIITTYSPQSQLNAPDFLMKFNEDMTEKDLFCDDRLRIFKGCKLDGFFISGKNVTARENCHFENVVILDDQDIPENSNFTNEVLY